MLFDPSFMGRYPVSALVNRPQNEGPECALEASIETQSQFRGESRRDRIAILSTKQNAPGLDLSLGTYVDQPSPKCCSRRIIDAVEKVENGTRVPSRALTGGRAFIRLVYDSGRSNSGLVRWAFPHISLGENMVLERVRVR